MSTTARDKATSDALAQFQLAGQYVGSREADALLYGAGYGFDAGRASVLSALTEERIRRSIRSILCDVANYPEPARHHLLGRELGSLINKATAAVVALIEQETAK